MDKLKSQNPIPVNLYLPLLWGTFLRFQGLAKQPLFVDEAFTADLILRNWSDMIRVAFQDVHPLLFYILSKPMLEFFPLTEWSLRLFPALCSVLVLALVTGVIRRYYNTTAGILAAWLLSWSSLHLYYAQDARMYSLLNLLWIIAPWFLMLALKSEEIWACFGWGVAVSGAIHTQFYGWVLWAVGFIWIFVFWQRLNKRMLRWWWISQIGALLTALPLLTVVVSTLSRGVGGTWIPSMLDPIRLWSLSLFGFTPERSRFLHGDLLSLYPWKSVPDGAFIILAVLVSIPPVVKLMRANESKKHKVVLLTGVIFGSLPILSSTLLWMIMKQPFWSYRPLIGATTWCLIVFAMGWSSFKGTKWLWLALFMMNLGPIIALKSHWIKDYSEIAFNRWSDEVPSKTTMVLDRFYHSTVFNFYAPSDVGSVYGIVPKGQVYELRQMVFDGTLRGQWYHADCSDLAQSNVSLYDPAGRRFQEGDSWPPCLQDKGGWVFNPQTAHWERTEDLVP